MTETTPGEGSRGDGQLDRLLVWTECPRLSVAQAHHRAGLVRRILPFAVAGLLWVLGAETVAVVAASASAMLLLGAVVRPTAVAHVDAVLARVGRAAGHGLTALLLGLVEAFVLLPIALLACLVRRDLLADRGDRTPGQWSRRPPVAPTARRPFALEVVAGRRTSARVAIGAVRLLGAVTILLVLNYGLGWMWDEWFGTHEPPIDEPGSAQTASELASSPAMVDASWAQEYWQEIRSLEYRFHPFILSRVGPFAGRYVNVEGSVRRSYQARDLDGDVPEVWFLGGSALWGEGQRDDHTIPSEVARLAESAGRPVRVVNLGQPGYTSWQSALLLEQQLAVREPPDLVVVYDGAADVAVQVERASVDPTHFNVRGLDVALTGRDSAREQVRDWWEAYQETSVVNRVIEQLEGLVSDPASAADGQGLAERVADLHARSVDLASFAADRHGVPVVFTWQAAEGVAGDGGAYRRVAGAPGPGPDRVVDLSEALDEVADEVYLDGVMTNEQGAAAVAAPLWALVRDALG